MLMRQMNQSDLAFLTTLPKMSFSHTLTFEKWYHKKGHERVAGLDLYVDLAVMKCHEHDNITYHVCYFQCPTTIEQVLVGAVRGTRSTVLTNRSFWPSWTPCFKWSMIRLSAYG